MSPLSIASVLGLLSQGANGKTYEDITKGLYLPPKKIEAAVQYQNLFSALEKDKGSATFSLVNQIYVKTGQEISKNFSDVAKDKFMAGIDSLDFAKSEKSAKTINEFVQSKTNKKIKEIIKAGDLNDDTELVLLNAIYFKADWDLKFDKSLTFKAPFYMNNKKASVEAEFMTQKGKFYYGDYTRLQSSVLQMRYADSSYAFVIVLPEKNVNLDDVERNLSFEGLNNFLSKDIEMIDVNVTIPKFGIEYEIDLTNVLEKVCISFWFKIQPLKFDNFTSDIN